MMIRCANILLFCFLAFGCTHSSYYQTEANYGKEVEALAAQYQLSPAYLKALIVLESSGRSEVPERFEKSIYQKLKKVKAGRMKMENITSDDLKDCSDQALRNLASSWGPFQLMGYHCFRLGISVSDLRGRGSVKWAVKWINDTYGEYIREKNSNKPFESTTQVNQTEEQRTSTM